MMGDRKAGIVRDEDMCPPADQAARIFYFAYAHNTPLGGQKHTYRHVDILAQAGYAAMVVHPGLAFRVTWFDNNTPVIMESEYLQQVDPSKDFIVLPEDLPPTAAYPGRKVIFNKNFFRSFPVFRLDDDGFAQPFHDDAMAIMAISQHNEVHLRMTFPEIPIFRVPVEVDRVRFPARQLARKAPLVLFSNKLDQSTKALLGTLWARARAGRNACANFEWICLEGFSEEQTSELLQDALLVISLSVAEGFCRLLLEAMACGCLVAGYHHGPIPEFVPRDSLFEHSDLEPLVLYIERVLASYPDGLSTWSDLLAKQDEIVRSFSPLAQSTAVLDVWQKILALPVANQTVQLSMAGRASTLGRSVSR